MQILDLADLIAENDDLIVPILPLLNPELATELVLEVCRKTTKRSNICNVITTMDETLSGTYNHIIAWFVLSTHPSQLNIIRLRKIFGYSRKQIAELLFRVDNKSSFFQTHLFDTKKSSKYDAKLMKKYMKCLVKRVAEKQEELELLENQIDDCIGFSGEDVKSRRNVLINYTYELVNKHFPTNLRIDFCNGVSEFVINLGNTRSDSMLFVFLASQASTLDGNKAHELSYLEPEYLEIFYRINPKLYMSILPDYDHESNYEFISQKDLFEYAKFIFRMNKTSRFLRFVRSAQLQYALNVPLIVLKSKLEIQEWIRSNAKHFTAKDLDWNHYSLDGRRHELNRIKKVLRDYNLLTE